MGKPQWMIDDELAENARRDAIRAKRKAERVLGVGTVDFSDQQDDAKREQAFLDHSEGEQFFLP